MSVLHSLKSGLPLAINGIHKAFGTRQVLHNIDLRIPAGQFVAVVGRSGCGKSTLLRLLAGQLPGTPATGQRTLGGVDFDADPAAYRRQLFLCDLATNAFDQMSGRECAAAWSADDPGFRADEWQALVEGFSLAEHIDKKLFMLSTGSRRKVWLAYALASGRPLVLLDEPTGGLDAPSTRCLWAALTRVAASGQRAVVVARTEGLDQVPLVGTITLPLGS